MTKLFSILIIGLIAACTTLPKQTELTKAVYSTIEAGPIDEAFTSPELAELECATGRTPANENVCAAFFGKPAVEAATVVTNKETPLLKKVRKDSEETPDIVKPTREQIEKTVPLTEKMKEFRARYLQFFTPAYTGREALVRSFEASLRVRSKAVEAKLANGDKSQRDYDLVITGTGVHGIIALHEALRVHPEAKILLIDEGDTAGATFRYGKDFYNINSSNRASNGRDLPLPGQGNLNELPGLPIQVSDMTAVKYPSANDLGSAIVTGLYAAAQGHPNIDVLFNSKAIKVDAGRTPTSSKTSSRNR